MSNYLVLRKTEQFNFLDYVGKWYETGFRKYHTLEHANTVAKECKLQSDNAALILAAFYHDAVYITGSDSNEKCSALALLNDAKRMQSLGAVVDWDTVNRAAELILGTTLAAHKSRSRITNPLQSILLDCDLRCLSEPYDRFIECQKDILEENFLSRDSLKTSAEFLRNLSRQRDFIYHTDFCRENWEEQAIDNIFKLCYETGV